MRLFQLWLKGGLIGESPVVPYNPKFLPLLVFVILELLQLGEDAVSDRIMGVCGVIMIPAQDELDSVTRVRRCFWF